MHLTIEGALHGGKNISTTAVERLLRSYGFEENSGKRHNWQHPEYTDILLNVDPNITLANPQAVKDAGHACEEVKKRREKQVAANSSETFPAWLNLPEGLGAAKNDNLLVVWEKEMPELAMRVHLKGNDHDSQTAYNQAYHQFSDISNVYKAKLKDLSEEYGVTATRTGSECVIAQADYSISRHLPVAQAGNSKNILDALSGLENEVKEIYDTRFEKAISLEERGFTLKMPCSEAKRIEITGNDLKAPIYVPVFGKLDSIDSAGLQQIEELLQKYPLVHAQQVQKEEKPAELPKHQNIVEKKIEEVKPALVLQPVKEEVPVNVISEHVGESGNSVADSPIGPTVISPPQQYKDTFGYQVSLRRFERELTEAQLAEQVQKIVGSGGSQNYPDLNAEKVMQWQMNVELPDQHVYLALRKVLVDENKKIPANEKEAAIEAFDHAYENTLAFKEGYSKNTQDAYAFGQMLYKYRKDGNLLDDGKLVKQVKENLQWQMEESPRDVNAKMMFNIMANDYVPSPGLARAILKALEKSKRFGDEERKQFTEAYDKVKPDIPKKTISPKNLVNEYANINILRRQLYQFFLDKNVEFWEIRLKADEKITVPEIAEILGTNGIKYAESDIWDKRGNALVAALEKLDVDHDKVQNFKDIFERFKNCTPPKQTCILKKTQL